MSESLVVRLNTDGLVCLYFFFFRPPNVPGQCAIVCRALSQNRQFCFFTDFVIVIVLCGWFNRIVMSYRFNSLSTVVRLKELILYDYDSPLALQDIMYDNV